MRHWFDKWTGPLVVTAIGAVTVKTAWTADLSTIPDAWLLRAAVSAVIGGVLVLLWGIITDCELKGKSDA